MNDALIDVAVADVGPDARVEVELETVRGGRLVRAAYVRDGLLAVEQQQPARLVWCFLLRVRDDLGALMPIAVLVTFAAVFMIVAATRFRWEEA